MAESIACPGCGKRFKFKSELEGKRVKCNACGTAFTAVGLSAAPTEPPPVPPPSPKWTPPAAPQRVLPVGYESAEPDGKPLWTDKQRKCRYAGIRLMIFGGAATILPFFGIQFTLLNWMGAWAILAGLLMLFAGIVLFGGAYLSRTRAFGGEYSALKIGGVAVGALVVFVIFLLGLLVVFGLIFRVSRSRPIAAAPTPAAKPAGTKALIPAAPIPPQRMSPPPRPAPSTLDEQHALHLHITGLGALPPAERMPRVSESVKQLGATLHTRGYRMSQSGDQLNATIGPVDDLQAAANAVTFGTASLDTSTRTINIVLDPTKLPTTQPAAPPKPSNPQDAMKGLHDALNQ